jgi:hypothetical protein
VLSRPHPFNQDDHGNTNALHDCGESRVASVLFDSGKTDITVNAVRTLIGHPGDTDANELVRALGKKNVGANEVSGNLRTYALRALSKSHRVPPLSGATTMEIPSRAAGSAIGSRYTVQIVRSITA